jgi:uroporphyrinogen-III synthase
VLPWAITRASVDAIRVAAELRSAGLDAFALPCIERRPRAIEPWSAKGFRVGFFTSVGAVDMVASALEKLQFELIAAIAPATKEALVRQGRPVGVEAAGGALELAEATATWLNTFNERPVAVWYPTSDLGERRDEQEQAVRCLEQVGVVSRVVAYETRAPQLLHEAVKALPPEYGVVFTSPSTVEHFVAARPQVTPLRVACWGASTLAAARPFFPAALELDRGLPLSESLAALEPRHV